MPIYKVAKYIEASVLSVLRQSFVDFELIGVDDASPDDSAQRFLDMRDPRLRLIRHPVNRGLAAARNTGIAAARGEYIALLDSDDIALSGRLARQVAFLDRSPRVVLCGGHMQFMDPAGRPLGSVHRAELRSDRIVPLLALRNAFFVSAVMFRRALATQVRYRTELPMAEDYAFYVDAARVGQLANIDALLLHYRQHPTSLTSTRPALMMSCVGQIHRSQLQAIGIVPSDRELQLHGHLSRLDLPTETRLLDEVEGWLLRLLQGRTAGGSLAAWRGVLGDAWFEVCSAASSLGPCVWQRYWRSPLARYAQAGWTRQAKFAAKSALRLDRRSLARRNAVAAMRSLLG
jgi:hypothetical protein